MKFVTLASQLYESQKGENEEDVRTWAEINAVTLLKIYFLSFHWITGEYSLANQDKKLSPSFVHCVGEMRACCGQGQAMLCPGNKCGMPVNWSVDWPPFWAMGK